MKNKVKALLLVVCMIITMIPAVSVQAEGDDPVVATVNGTEYTDLQEAIKAAAPSGTVEIVSDVTVDTWVMFAETMTIGNGKLITLNINGLTINGNGHSLNVNSIESAENGDRLFYDAQNLNINNLLINYANGVAGGIGLQSGTINKVTFNGGTYGVLPRDGEITIKDCTFKTNNTAIYYEEERDNLIVTGNTFELGSSTNVILLRGDTIFTDNIIVSGRTVNVVSGSPVVTGNTFADGVRFKVYNDATAEIKNNKLDIVVFDEEGVPVKSTFDDNKLSDNAKKALEDAGIAIEYNIVITVPEGTVVEVKDAEGNLVEAGEDGNYKLVNGDYTYAVSKDGFETKSETFKVDGEDKTIAVELSAKVYTVTFMDENGVYKTVTCKHGDTFEMPDVPVKEGYTVKWDTTIDKVTSDLTVKAVYTKNPVEDAETPEDEAEGEIEPEEEVKPETENKSSVPKTADMSDLGLWTVLMIISVGAVTACTVKKQRR